MFVGLVYGYLKFTMYTCKFIIVNTMEQIIFLMFTDDMLEHT